MNLDFLAGKSILITGGTGSFGQKFVKTVLEQTMARRVIVFSRDELKQHEMQHSIVDPEGRLRFFIGDVRDKDRLERAFNNVDFVVHAAALKQVPALEYNPFEAVKTNLLGTQNVIDAAINQGVKKVVLISTDKAANPANLYGATKLCAEKLIISGNAYTSGTTKLSAVRYGNVVGSRGSILTVINQQRPSGVITLTHEEMTRFWITLNQGVQLVLLTLSKMHGGEIFIPKIPSMKMVDFIKQLAPECEVKTIGIRPGEKIHEMLLTVEEARHTKFYGEYFIIMPEHNWWKKDAHEGGEALPEGYTYSSLNNDAWLDEAGFNDLLASL